MSKNFVINCDCPCDGCMFFSVCFKPSRFSDGSTFFVPSELNFCSNSIVEVTPSQSYYDTFINP